MTWGLEKHSDYVKAMKEKKDFAGKAKIFMDLTFKHHMDNWMNGCGCVEIQIYLEAEAELTDAFLKVALNQQEYFALDY